MVSCGLEVEIFRKVHVPTINPVLPSHSVETLRHLPDYHSDQKFRLYLHVFNSLRPNTTLIFGQLLIFFSLQTMLVTIVFVFHGFGNVELFLFVTWFSYHFSCVFFVPLSQTSWVVSETRSGLMYHLLLKSTWFNFLNDFILTQLLDT